MAYLPPSPSPVPPPPKGAQLPTNPASPAFRQTWNGFPSPPDHIHSSYPFDNSWSHSNPHEQMDGSPTPPALSPPLPIHTPAPPQPHRRPPPPPSLPPRPSSARPTRPPRPKVTTIRTSRPLPTPPSRSSFDSLAPPFATPIRSMSAVNLSDSSWSDSRPYYSPASSYAADDGYYPSNISFRSSLASFETLDRTPTLLTDELEQQILEEDGIRRFQSGELNDNEAEWHRLVPHTAIEALPKKEVQRQSIVFELIKSERDYVADLRTVQDVFISGLYTAQPPVLPSRAAIDAFVLEVYSDLPAIRAHHERMLARLFERQRDQHPIVLSVADLVLDGALAFSEDYEVYIKHYPLAEARHRRELKHNPAYATLLQHCSLNPRVRKRDLVTFLSRPVTRLPRLSLLLDNMARQTDPDHPDAQATELILGILKDFLSSTQPGIAAADAKVKFWTLCESMVFRRGEILDMDLYDEKRTLVHSATVARRRKTEYNTTVWSDLVVALLDNYLLLTHQETHMGNVKHVVVSRPIPLQFLRIASFSGPPEQRRDDRTPEDECTAPALVRALPLPVHHPQRSMWPFTIFHACSKVQRRYTLYADSEAKRGAWHEYLVDAIGVLHVQQEANRLFAAISLSPTFFRLESKPRERDKPPGPIICAASFNNGKRDLVAVGCSDGVWVGFRADGKSYRKVLDIKHVTALGILKDFDQLIVHHDGRLVSYSLDMLSRAAQLELPTLGVWSSFEKISGSDEHVAFFRSGVVQGRVLIVYAVKKPFRQTMIHALEAVHNPAHLPRQGKDRSQPFRQFGSPFYVPKDAFDIVLLQKRIAVCTEKGLTINDPTDLSTSSLVPNFNQVSNDKAMASLKARCEASKPLGMVRTGENELMIVYEEFGCYITKHGDPARRSGYLRWEVKATSVGFRSTYVLLFSDEFVEIREASTGRLVQVIEGKQIRLIGDAEGGWPLLVARQGPAPDSIAWDDLVELVETQPLQGNDDRGAWSEWGLW